MFLLSFEQLLPGLYYYLAVAFCLYFLSYFIEVILNLPNSNCINTDYVELKRFINRICQEVINISDTLEFSSESVPKASFDPQTYEELLATAVLNKITTEYLQKKKHGMSHQVGAEENSNTIENEDIDFESYSSRLSKVQSYKISLPDLLNEFDDENSHGNAENGNWEDNWSLKYFGSADHKISMLIPMPNHEVKAKIGDVEIDEISDSSNKDEIDSENLNDFNDDDYKFVTEKVHGSCDTDEECIQQQPSCEKLNENDEVLFNDISGLSSSRDNIDEIFEQILMTENDTNNNDIYETEQALFSETITNEKESSKYKSPLLTQYLVTPIKPVKVKDALKNTPSNTGEIERKISNAEEALTLVIRQEGQSETDENSQNTPPIKGSIAEREHLKWLKAAPIQNNPYSPEALNKRLSGSQEKFIDVHPEKQSDPENDFDDQELRGDITKYKRDYYINRNITISPKSPIHKINENMPSDYLQDHTNDSSLSVSDDSLTRIYTLSSQETKIVLPSEESSTQSSHNTNVGEEINKNNERIDKFEDSLPLPSVKKLAEFYANTGSTSDFDFRQHEPMNIPLGISKTTSKKYGFSDVPAKPFASITARTLPPKIKEDLRKSLNPNDSTIIRSNERNVSPDIQQGLTRNSIAYFENFYK